VEQVTKTGQLFLGSKFAGVASTATALSGTGLPPCPAYDFSCALRGTLARTVEPGEKGTPANLKESAAAFAVNVEQTLSVTNSWTAKSNLFKKTAARVSPANEAGTWAMGQARTSLHRGMRRPHDPLSRG
jgi:hypothetical protein